MVIAGYVTTLYMDMPVVVADYSAAKRQAGGLVPPFPGGGQECERRCVVRRLPVSHTQGDTRYTQLTCPLSRDNYICLILVLGCRVKR